VTIILPITNQAGSAGKTTTTVGVAGALAKRGYKVVVVDADGQANASHHLGIDDPKYTLGDVLLGRCELQDALVETATPGLWVLPSAERQDMDVQELTRRPVGSEQRMRLALEPLRGDGDLRILIDCPGALGIMTVAAMVAASGNDDTDPANVVTVIAPQAKEAQGIPKIERTIKDVRDAYNPKLRLGAILPCIVPPTGAGMLYGQIVENAKAVYGDIVGPSTRRSVRVPEAYVHQALIQDHAPNDAITLDIENVTNWLIEKNVL
jgi:chromosome partitioning protein